MNRRRFTSRPLRSARARLIYFADGVRLPKKSAVRLLLLELLASQASDASYSTAEQQLERVVNPANVRSRDLASIEAGNHLMWAEKQWPKIRKRDRER